ncbi:hypothetical protein [Demequina sp.]|uniref:hypothetical protein n=1 Tax=Demequina sp. TaxID=2050685 RepID=UPI0025B815F0|nr:hypothetical protein [Demequina sp.]
MNFTVRNTALAQAYATVNRDSVAFLDETYDVDPMHDSHFYVMTAVVVKVADLNYVRDGIVELVGGNYWHTTQSLRTEQGRQRTHELLEYLGDPAGGETCVIRHTVEVDLGDRDGESARKACLEELLTYLANPGFHGPGVTLVVLERRRPSTSATADASTKTGLVAQGLLTRAIQMLQVSPSDEPLLWLPDLACSAYRQQIVHGNRDYFELIEQITELI